MEDRGTPVARPPDVVLLGVLSGVFVDVIVSFVTGLSNSMNRDLLIRHVDDLDSSVGSSLSAPAQKLMVDEPPSLTSRRVFVPCAVKDAATSSIYVGMTVLSPYFFEAPAAAILLPCALAV